MTVGRNDAGAILPYLVYTLENAIVSSLVGLRRRRRSADRDADVELHEDQAGPSPSRRPTWARRGTTARYGTSRNKRRGLSRGAEAPSGARGCRSSTGSSIATRPRGGAAARASSRARDHDVDPGGAVAAAEHPLRRVRIDALRGQERTVVNFGMPDFLTLNPTSDARPPAPGAAHRRSRARLRAAACATRSLEVTHDPAAAARRCASCSTRRWCSTISPSRCRSPSSSKSAASTSSSRPPDDGWSAAATSGRTRRFSAATTSTSWRTCAGWGAEFARHVPEDRRAARAGRRASTDPHVERLIESFAFLTARLERRLDLELPEIGASLLGVLYPNLVNPVPPLAIARFQVDPDAGRS